MCPRTLSDRHDQTETDRALWFFSTGPQWTNSNLQTGLRFSRGSVPEKSQFSDRGLWLRPPGITRVKVSEVYKTRNPVGPPLNSESNLNFCWSSTDIRLFAHMFVDILQNSAEIFQNKINPTALKIFQKI